MNVFDILGPVMIGPSSSHTAGAARIGFVARKLFGGLPSNVKITLFDSFAKTGKGHGTDKALVGGLLGFQPDDSRIPESFTFAQKSGLSYVFELSDRQLPHPNTAAIELWDDNKHLFVTGVSVGGGNIEITRINTAEVSFCAQYHTLIVFSIDRFGTLAQISGILSEAQINIAFMRLSREKEGESVVMVIETDQAVTPDLCAQIQSKENINDVIYVAPF